MSTRSYFVVLIAFVFLCGAHALANNKSTRVHHPRRLQRRTRHVVWHPMFRGSHEMLVRENEEIDRLELARIENDDELAELEENQTLVPIAETRALLVADNLTASRRYCRPWTREFLQDFSSAFYQEFRQPIRVTSLVRTVAQQKKLRRSNRNAGPVEGETASTHLTGITVDIGKRGLTRKQHRWIEQYFLPLKEQGLIEPVEERRQAVFHVVVYNGYSDWRESKRLSQTDPKAVSN